MTAANSQVWVGIELSHFPLQRTKRLPRPNPRAAADLPAGAAELEAVRRIDF